MSVSHSFTSLEISPRRPGISIYLLKIPCKTENQKLSFVTIYYSNTLGDWMLKASASVKMVTEIELMETEVIELPNGAP